jgi:Superinfection immunity protein
VFDSKMLLLLIIVMVLALGVHFLPTIIAFRRNHHNKVAIFLVNLFLGWTVLGWVAALVWSATTTQPVVVVQGQQQPPRS